MVTKKVRHPFSYTLDLLKLAIDRLPPTYPDLKSKLFKERLQYFWDYPETDYADIQATIAELGKDSWPFRKAYEEMYANFGRSSEESHLLENLDRGIREKYERFLHEGGKINHIENAKSAEDLMKASPFERYFTPEEKFAVEQALLAAREASRQEIDDLVMKTKKPEYDKLVKDFVIRQDRIDDKMTALRHMSSVSSKWEPVITDRLKTLEEGWSVIEQGLSETLLDKELEYWHGTLEAVLHAA
jgi:hypothetical protein